MYTAAIDIDESRVTLPDSSLTCCTILTCDTDEIYVENNQESQPLPATATDPEGSCEPSLEDSKKIIEQTNPSLKISSLTHSQQLNEDNDEDEDEKEKENTPQQQSKRVHEAADALTKIKQKQGILKTLVGNFNKKTYCYKMVTDDNTTYFVKIFEDATTNPTVVPKKLYKDALLKEKLKKYILLPAFKPQKTRLDAHTYEVVIYPFIKHLTLEDITLKALKQGYIDPMYHRRASGGSKARPHAAGYKMRLLRRFAECVMIAIKLKDDRNGFVDMDLSPDNFIVTTDIADAAENDDVKWDEVTEAKNAQCLKIDHESMLYWTEKLLRVDKPMKPSFKAPEVNAKDDSGEYQAFDVEKANVYQIGATFIYVLYGQIKEVSADGDEFWKSLPPKGIGGWQNLDWTPKFIDLQWLQKCVDRRPHIRPTYDDLLRSIRWELKQFDARRRSNFPASRGGPSTNRGRNNFQNHFGATNRHGNGDVTIMYVPQSGARGLRQAVQQQYVQPQRQRPQQQQQHPNVNWHSQFQPQPAPPQQQRHQPQQQRQQHAAMRLPMPARQRGVGPRQPNASSHSRQRHQPQQQDKEEVDNVSQRHLRRPPRRGQ